MADDEIDLEDRPDFLALLAPGAQVSKPKPDKKGAKRFYIYCKYKGPHDSGFKRVSSSKYFAKEADEAAAMAKWPDFLKKLAPTPRKKRASPSTDAAGSAGESQGGRSLRSGPKKPPKGREASGKSAAGDPIVQEKLAAAFAELDAENQLAAGYSGGDEADRQSPQQPNAEKRGQRRRRAPFGTRRKERQRKGGKLLLSEQRRKWRTEQIAHFTAFLERGEMGCVVDKDGAPTRHQDLTPAAARELTRRIGSMCFFLELANEMSNKSSNVDVLADIAGRPFKLQGSTVRRYVV